ncbi:MAG: hypothetical protein JNJ57_11605, partial [Saprospiraceae bacterium]|nr:hypothetical protein [Saprospiraceae bacterium]
WSLSFDGEKPGAFCLSYYIPAVLTLLFGFMAYGHFNRLKLIGSYIKKKYEPWMNPTQSENPEFGWENYLETSLKGKGSFLAKSRVWMWGFLLVIDFGIGVYLTCCNGD